MLSVSHFQFNRVFHGFGSISSSSTLHALKSPPMRTWWEMGATVLHLLQWVDFKLFTTRPRVLHSRYMGATPATSCKRRDGSTEPQVLNSEFCILIGSTPL